jgi:hypothetical protein
MSILDRKIPRTPATPQAPAPTPEASGVTPRPVQSLGAALQKMYAAQLPPAPTLAPLPRMLNRGLPGTPGTLPVQPTADTSAPPVTAQPTPSLGEKLQQMYAADMPAQGVAPPPVLLKQPPPLTPGDMVRQAAQELPSPAVGDELRRMHAAEGQAAPSVADLMPVPFDAVPTPTPQTMEEWRNFRFPARETPAPVVKDVEKEIEKEGRGGDGEGQHKPTDPSFYMPLSVGAIAPPKFDETGRGLGGHSAGIVVDKPTPSLTALQDLARRSRLPPQAPAPSVSQELKPRTGPRIKR